MDFILCIRHSSIGRGIPQNIQPSLWRCGDGKTFPFQEASFKFSIYLTDTVSATRRGKLLTAWFSGLGQQRATEEVNLSPIGHSMSAPSQTPAFLR